MRLLEYDRDDRIFIDANIFIYNALDHPLYGDSCSNLIDGVITTHLIDRILFKILTAKASCYLDKTTIWDIKDKMKDMSFSKKVYSAVRKYADYLDELTSYGVTLPSGYGHHNKIGRILIVTLPETSQCNANDLYTASIGSL